MIRWNLSFLFVILLFTNPVYARESFRFEEGSLLSLPPSVENPRGVYPFIKDLMLGVVAEDDDLPVIIKIVLPKRIKDCPGKKCKLKKPKKPKGKH